MYPVSKFGKRVASPSDYPKTPHYQIHIVQKVTEYSGWEKEEGPAAPTPFTVCYVYESEAEWRTALGGLFMTDYNRKDVVGFRVTPTPVSVEVKVGVTVDDRDEMTYPIPVR